VSKYASWTHGKLPLPELAELKRRGQKLAMVTAYDFPSGRIADEAGVELVLVGDSAGMVVLGNESTVPVTMDELLMLTRAVVRGAKRPLVIADMPFGSFQGSDEPRSTTPCASSRRQAPTPSSSRAPARRFHACRRSSARACP